MNPANDNATKMAVDQVAQEGMMAPPPSSSSSKSVATNKDDNNDNHDEADDYTFWERQSVRVANRPCTYFWISFLLSFGLGMIGLFLGNFSVAVDNVGWQSRGTLIANRETQFMLIHNHLYQLWADGGENGAQVWNELLTNVQPGWNVASDEDDDDNVNGTRRLSFTLAKGDGLADLGHHFQQGMQQVPWKQQDIPFWMDQPRASSRPTTAATADTRSLLLSSIPPVLSSEMTRRLQLAANATGLLQGCDTSWYTSSALVEESHLWPVWRTVENDPSSSSLLNAAVVHQMCVEEQKTQNYLEESGLCFGCGNTTSRCLQPYSPVLFARLTVQFGMDLSCQQLADSWSLYQSDMQIELLQCVKDLRLSYDLSRDGFSLPASCPDGFFPTMVDELYEGTGLVQYSSSIFATSPSDVEALYDNVDKFATGDLGSFRVAYDTQYEDFVGLSLEAQLNIDMSLAIGSAVVTTIAMVVHTRSPFLSLIGLLQIVLSFPLAFFFYTSQLEFFPFLNFIGIFVIFGLGADDVFVAVDKWKNARLENPKGSTSAIAAKALPDAAVAMLLTSATTAISFFGTAVCPVAPILCFAVFCGLLVVFDYLLCVLLVFPALCIYDAKRHQRNSSCQCVSCHRSSSNSGVADNHADDNNEGISHVVDDISQEEHGNDVNSTRIRRLLLGFYTVLHKARWVLLLVSLGAFIVSAIVAASIEMPTSSDVRLYSEDDNQYEQNYRWRQQLLYETLEKQGGSTAFVIWGVSPADTGDRNNPATWSQLVLDDDFEPSRQDSQVYLRNFCDRFFANEFASQIEEDYACPINRFDAWLEEQSNLENPEDVYLDNCNGFSGLPIREDQFDKCIYAWSRAYNELNILARNGKVEVMLLVFSSRVRYDSPFDILTDEWQLIEDWFEQEKSSQAPVGVNNGYFTSADFWWYDTNGQMLMTAYTSAGIAMLAAAIVILISSRSLVLTLFSTLTVGFVLASVTAMLVAIGWTLGFLEAILFAILIGISCDFVIHFSHSYASLKGHASRSERTQYALVFMGPSILAGAFTTFAAAAVMLFTVITFFRKFAVVLFVTVILSLVGSFIVFLTLTDCFGPSDPTFLVDKVLAKCAKWRGRKEHVMQGEEKTQHGIAATAHDDSL